MKFDSAAKRLRGRRAQERRARWFARFPLCADCTAEGRVSLAEELDHRVPLSQGGRDDESNFQGLCVAHHRSKTERDLGYRPRPTIGADGWPV
jgi:5-methylcytosine-specific restriction protein A